MNQVASESEYVREILLPFVRTFGRAGIELAVRGVQGNYLYMTDSFAKNVLGLDSVKNCDQLLESGGMIQTQHPVRDIGFARLVAALQVERQKVDFLLLNQRSDGVASHASTTPLFSPMGIFLGYMVIHKPVDLSSCCADIYNRYNLRFNSDRISFNNIFGVDLSISDQIVLTLLLLGYTQSEIATYFKCSRSYIAKIISENLCPKFGVSGFSARYLVEAAVDDGYQWLLPKSLLFQDK